MWVVNCKVCNFLVFFKNHGNESRVRPGDKLPDKIMINRTNVHRSNTFVYGTGQ